MVLIKYICYGIIFLLMFIAFDCSMGVQKTEEAEIVGMKYEPQRTYTQPVKVGDVTTIQTRTDPEEWRVELEVRDGTVWRNVTEQQYNSLDYGDYMTVRYRVGKFTGVNY